MIADINKEVIYNRCDVDDQGRSVDRIRERLNEEIRRNDAQDNQLDRMRDDINDIMMRPFMPPPPERLNIP